MNITSYPGSCFTKEVVAGAGGLVEHVDKRILVWLGDGRIYVGILRSVDLFANLVLHNTVERIHIGDEYEDVAQGILIVRGENVALLGELKDKSDKKKTTGLVATVAEKEQRKEEINKMKVQANFKEGKIFTPEDYF